jgi:hypothetical protein
MDALGDADELAFDDDLPPGREPLFSAETRAIAGAGLVLMSVFSTTIFQYATFLLFNNNDGSMGQTTQYLLLAGPCGVVAAAGAGLGWSTRGRDLSPALRGTAGAAVVVGVSLALLVVGTVVAGHLWGDDTSQGF